MMARASAVDVIAGADRLTHVALIALAIVDAQRAGDQRFLAIAPPLAWTTVTSCKPLILRLVPTAITVRPPLTASVSPDLRNFRRTSAPASPSLSTRELSSPLLGMTKQSRRPKWLFNDWARVKEASRAGSIEMLTMPRSRASLR